jgi:hypothetical protein
MFEKIAQVFCGEDRFDIVDEKAPKCFFNGIDVIGVRAHDAGMFPSIVGMLVVSACTVPETEVKIKKNPSYADFLRGLVDTLTKSDQVKIQVLDSKPDETVDNKPKESRFNVQSLDDFRDKLKTYASCFDDTVALAGVLLKTKLPKTIHGFNELNKILIKTKTATENLSSVKEQYEIASEQMDNKIGQVMVAVANRMNGPSGKKILRSAIAQVINNFDTVKRVSSEMLCSFNPLYNVNQVFKKYTGYPATWYFDPSVFYSFTERYKDASDNLIDMARAESAIIRPLQLWKNRFTGV